MKIFEGIWQNLKMQWMKFILVIIPKELNSWS